LSPRATRRSSDRDFESPPQGGGNSITGPGPVSITANRQLPQRPGFDDGSRACLGCRRKRGLANKLLAVRGAGSPVTFIVSAMPEASARLPPHARRSGGLESARQLARKSYSFMSFYCLCTFARVPAGADDVPYTGVNSRRRGATASVRKCDVTTQQTSEGTTRWLNSMLPYPRVSCQASCSGQRAFAT
jgi:hypothetical protein